MKSFTRTCFVIRIQMPYDDNPIYVSASTPLAEIMDKYPGGTYTPVYIKAAIEDKTFFSNAEIKELTEEEFKKTKTKKEK